MTANSRSPLPACDICIVHLADARYYPLFKRQAFTLRDAGYRVALVSWEGVAGEGNPRWEGIDVYPVTLPAESFSGAVFFVQYMRRLTHLLKRLPSRLYQAVDPVTLPSVRVAAAFHRARYNYFSLEYFQGAEQLVGRPARRWAWRQIERWGLARARNSAAVCRASSERMASRFGITPPVVVRNVPLRSEAAAGPDGALRRDAGIDRQVPLVVFKGDLGGGRGLVPFVKALAAVDGPHLALLGDGPFRSVLQSLSVSNGTAGRVHFAGRVAPERFPSLLAEADIGHCLHENTGTNMPFTLPSKLFDYLHAGLPVLCGNQGEMAEIVRGHDVGWTVDPGNGGDLIDTLRRSTGACRDPRLRARARDAARAYCWDAEQRTYLEFVAAALA